jgi:hypothetical protein
MQVVHRHAANIQLAIIFHVIILMVVIIPIVIKNPLLRGSLQVMLLLQAIVMHVLIFIVRGQLFPH